MSVQERCPRCSEPLAVSGSPTVCRACATALIRDHGLLRSMEPGDEDTLGLDVLRELLFVQHALFWRIRETSPWL